MSSSSGGGLTNGPAYMYEYSNTELDGNLSAWTEWDEFPHMITTISMDGLGFILSLLTFFLAVCGKSLRGVSHGWLLLGSALAMTIFTALDLTGTLGRHEITPSWPSLPWGCEVLSGLYSASIFAMFVLLTLTSLERVCSVYREIYPVSGFGDCVTRVLITLTWILALGYGTYFSFTTIVWTTEREVNVCLNVVRKYPSLAQFLTYVICLLTQSGAVLTLILWLRSEEVKLEDKVVARGASLVTIASSILFWILASPTVVLDLKHYGDVYGDPILQQIAFYCLRLVPIILPITWMIGDTDIQAALCCSASSGPDENTFLLERMTTSGPPARE